MQTEDKKNYAEGSYCIHKPKKKDSLGQKKQIKKRLLITWLHIKTYVYRTTLVNILPFAIHIVRQRRKDIATGN